MFVYCKIKHKHKHKQTNKNINKTENTPIHSLISTFSVGHCQKSLKSRKCMFDAIMT